MVWPRGPISLVSPLGLKGLAALRCADGIGGCGSLASLGPVEQREAEGINTLRSIGAFCLARASDHRLARLARPPVRLVQRTPATPQEENE